MLTAIAILGCLAAAIAVALWRRESARRQALATELEEVRSGLDSVRREARNRIERTRREARRREREARWSAIEQLLPAIDSLESAVRQDLERKEAPDADDPSTLGEGIALTLEEFERGLASLSIERVHPTPGDPFDADCQEALQIIDDRDDSDAGSHADEDHEVQVHQCIRSGYRSEERVLRPAGVVVKKVPLLSEEQDSDPEQSNASADAESNEHDQQPVDKPVSHPSSSNR